jgi:hypothetical protein
VSRVYARREDNDERVLLYLTCDEPGCTEKLKPGPDVAKSGWMKQRLDDGAGGCEYYYCDRHNH